MQLLFFCPRWGCESEPWDSFFKRVKEKGYDGVELSLGVEFSDEEIKTVVSGLAKYDLLLIGQHWQTKDRDFSTHMTSYEKHLYQLIGANPLFINSQTGKDYYTEAQNMELINRAAEISQETGVRIIHETHRGKWSFAAHITHDYLKKHPQIRLTLDASHWCNVAESMLEDQNEALEMAIKHTDHIHARVGFEEGPQIMDPRAPEWQEAVATHLKWWDKVVKQHRLNGSSLLTITPEFGAPPYLQLLPYTQQPIVSQWDINEYMFQFLKKRYQE